MPSIEPESEITTDVTLRENFQETWIFETIDLDASGTASKKFTTLDEITTWQVSAFSIKNNSVVSVTDPQELTVKNDFFVVLNLPYSIRHTEVLRLDILVHNYVNKNLSTKVELEDAYGAELVALNPTSCLWEVDQSETTTTIMDLPPMSVQNFPFHIRSRKTAEGEKTPREVAIKVRATGTDNTGKTYVDAIKKELKVEPVGIKKYAVDAKVYMLNGESNTHGKKITSDTLTGNANVLITGDYLTESINLDARE